MVLIKVRGPALTFCSTSFLASCTGGVPGVNRFQLAPWLPVGFFCLFGTNLHRSWIKESPWPYSISVDYVLLRHSNQG